MKKTTTRRKTATMETELACSCGNRLQVSVNKNGWLISLIAVALANHWQLHHQCEVEWANVIEANCPNCVTEHHCQCRDC